MTNYINIISIPSDIGSVYAGKSKAPTAFKSAGLQQKLQDVKFTITETTSLPQNTAAWKSSTRSPNGARNEENVVKACRQVKESVSTALESDASLSIFQLILAGECLYCPPILSAYWFHTYATSKKIGIIYVDADCDLYTPSDNNSSGNIAGMTLTHLTLKEGGLESMKCFSRPDGSGVVDAENIALFGLNITSPANKTEHLAYLFNNRFRVTTSDAVQASPIKRAEETLAWMEKKVDYILVHLDVDVIDPGLFPLGNVPSWTGLGFEECMGALKVFLGSEKVVGLSVAEVNVDHDPGLEMTTRLVDGIVEGLRLRVK